jgi:hypothetical protein
MADFTQYDAVTHSEIKAEDDYNNICDHGLEKTAEYILRKNGSYYEAIKGGTATDAGNIIYGGSADAGGISGTDCSAVLTAAFATGTVSVAVKAGTYSCTSAVTMQPADRLIGAGRDSTFFEFSSGVNGFRVNEGGAASEAGGGIYHITLKTDETSIYVYNLAFFEVEGCNLWSLTASTCNYGVRLDGFSFISKISHNNFRHYEVSGVSVEDTSNGAIIESNNFNPPDVNTTLGIYTEVNGAKIRNNWMEHATGRTSTHISVATAGATHTFITSNTLAGLNAAGSYYCIHISSSAKKTIIQGNYLAPQYSTAIYIELGSSYVHQIIGNTIRYSGDSAIYATTSEGQIIGNEIQATTGVGASSIIVVGNRWQINNNSIIGEGAIAETAIQIAGTANNCTVKNNIIRYFETCVDLGASSSGTTVTGNEFVLHTTGVNGVAYAGLIRDNTGFVTENHGTGTIPNGSTEVTVTHGLTTTPTVVHILPITNPTNPIVWMYMTTTTTTTFKAKCGADPGASGVDFWWYAACYN